MKKFFILVTITTCGLFNANAKEFDFVFFGFTERSIRVKWEIYTTEPTGFPEGNIRTFVTGETVITLDLKKGEKIVFEAFAADNANKRSLLENREFSQLDKKNHNPINFTVFEKKDLKDILTIPQLALKVSQDKYASSLTRNRDEILTDRDLPIGTLIFYDGINSYYKPTTNIVTSETTSERLNQYYHRIEDLIRIESNMNFGASGNQLGFLKAISVDLDLSSVKFMDFRIEIDNLNKKQAQSYAKDPYSIFENNTDPWLDAVFARVNSTTNNIASKSKYKLYFVTSKLSADKVILRRRTYKEFNKSLAIGLDIENIIDVAGSGQHYSLASYEKLDSVLNYYVDYEAMDMTLVLFNEASKKAIGNEIENMETLKAAINREIDESKAKVLETYNLLTQYSTLPQSVSGVNQVIAICKGREFEREKPLQIDSLGNLIPDTAIDAANARIKEFNRYLNIILEEIQRYEQRVELLKGIDAKILQLKTDAPTTINKDTKISAIDNAIFQRLIQGSPN